MICPLCLSNNAGDLFQRIDPRDGPRDYYQCDDCYLVFLDPHQHLSPKEEKERYNTHQNNPEDKRYVEFLSRLTQPLTKFLKPGFTGLDFGCGPGPAVSHILNKQGFHVSNYDPFYFPHDQLIQTPYDFITATEVVEHLRSPRETFQLLDQLLKPEESYLGVMTQILVPNIAFKDWWYHKDPTHVCFYSRKTLEWIGSWLGWETKFKSDNVVIYRKG